MLYFKLLLKVVLFEINGDVKDILYGGYFEFGGYIEILLFWILEFLKYLFNINCVKFWIFRIKNRDFIEKSF